VNGHALRRTHVAARLAGANIVLVAAAAVVFSVGLAGHEELLALAAGSFLLGWGHLVGL
jgi:hypothetical protein